MSDIVEDRQLLEVAAKAVSRKLKYNYLGYQFAGTEWDPRIDSAQALCAMVKLELCVDWDENEKCAYVEFENYIGEKVQITEYGYYGEESVRMAIFRAAVVIGLAMP